MGSSLGKLTDWTGITNIEGKKRAGQVGREAAELQADYQQQALDYMMAQDELPQELRQGAMSQLGGFYGIGGDPGASLSAFQSSPIYQAMQNARASGEESILRQQAATGGLRTGTTQQNLAGFNQRIEDQALMNYMGGLTGLANTQTYAPQIAQMTSGIGQTLGQGMVAEQQGLLAGREDLRNFAQNERQYGHEVGMSFLGGSGGGSGGMFSDSALKENVEKIGTQNGFNVYKWSWNDLAKDLGLYGESSGVLADEVEKVKPEAVSMNNGFKFVNYDMIGVQHG